MTRRLPSARAALVAATLGGCSFALSGPDPARPVDKAPECDAGKGLVMLDGVIAGSLAIGGLAVASSDSGAAVGPLLIAALFAGSALRGNYVVDHCRRDIGNYYATQAPPLPHYARLPSEDADARAERGDPRPTLPRGPRVEPSGPPPAAPVASAPPPPVTTPPAMLPPPAMSPATPPPAPVATPPAPTPPTPAMPARSARRDAGGDDPWRQFWKELP